MFKWTGSFGNSYVSVDGVNLGTTDSFDPNSKVYFWISKLLVVRL
ncbi:hypothetical protein [Clostridium sp. UBA3887]